MKDLKEMLPYMDPDVTTFNDYSVTSLFLSLVICLCLCLCVSFVCQHCLLISNTKSTIESSCWAAQLCFDYCNSQTHLYCSLAAFECDVFHYLETSAYTFIYVKNLDNLKSQSLKFDLKDQHNKICKVSNCQDLSACDRFLCKQYGRPSLR